MKASRCNFVAVRDSLTARGLQRNGVNAKAPGNPMMDGLKTNNCPTNLKEYKRVMLLCGSRVPEAIKNLSRFLNVLDELISDFHKPIVVLVAIGMEPNLLKVEEVLQDFGYTRCKSWEGVLETKSVWGKGSLTVLVGIGKFSEWASFAEVGLANAGTATEQLVGLGIPCVSLPGKGPQFKKAFAIRQSRLLGGSVIPCDTSHECATRLKFLLLNKSFNRTIAFEGKKRMGSPGGSHKIALNVLKYLVNV